VDESTTGQELQNALARIAELENELSRRIDNLDATSGLVRWNVYESSLGYDRDAGKERWGEWVLVGSHKTELEAERQIRLRKEHNHAKNSDRDYGIVEMRWENRHELTLPANSKVTNASSGNYEPDYESARSSTFNKLKIGKQSAAGKAIDTFIKEIRNQESGVK